MFQIKFVRNPLKDTDPHKWLLEIISQEAPKVKKQIPKGAHVFVLMTNVPGTAHLDAGSIDQANKLLSSALGIPSICLWRNDLSRRLDSAWDLKWIYPELMTGTDLIRLVIENNLTDDKERRATAIRAFVASQFSTEQYVKFKQVDLDNGLLDLFIDVPIGASLGMRWHRSGRYAIMESNFEQWQNPIYSQKEEEVVFMPPPDIAREYRLGKQPSIGAATFLLNQTIVGPSLTVVEGAPGQGKSTITQYICQVHRMRLLGKKSDIQRISENHRASPFRLPIKVDLRDFAVWLTKRNPFSAEGEELGDSWEKSLESFLAALVRSQSGGARFDVSDFHSVSRLSSMLLVLDGLDEVADIKRRTEVVSEISRGVDRLQSIAAALQVIVTSRPAAFENSPGLPEEVFRHLSLDSVTQELIEEYANKWLKARRLGEKESSEVKKILREKLTQPHLKDLARNPMQLAILLSLIHTRGASLPDKRTALYDNYVELFFNRESEKSSIVRDNRDLLIDIHRYLGWLLHTESEQANGGVSSRPAGAIEETRLKNVLREYLISEGRDPAVTNEIFSGLIERVVALVSRVQGTYEFEVQPLREYFAARFLHETAPYSPVGSEKKGTRPDRFDAIARNFYWLNVTRFFAGCYSKGELPSLIDRLDELMKDEVFRSLSHPRLLGATLLGDWVFTQHPKSVSQVVRQVIDGVGLRFVLASTGRRQSNSQSLVLPAECGKRELLEHCFGMLCRLPPKDYALDVLDLLSANATQAELMPFWKSQAFKLIGDERTIWLEYGLHLGCVPVLEITELHRLLSDIDLTPNRINTLIRSRRVDFLESSEKISNTVISMLLSRECKPSPGNRQLGGFDALSAAIGAERYAIAFRDPAPAPLREVQKHYSPRGRNDLNDHAFEELNFSGAKNLKAVVKASIELEGVPASEWASKLWPWENLVNLLIERFGETWAARQLALVASAIRSSSETCVDSPELFNSSRPLCRRARYARLRAGTPTWWKKQFTAATNTDQKIFCAQLYFVWASSNTMAQTIGIVNKIVAEFSPSDWSILFDSVLHGIENTRKHSRDSGPDLSLDEIDLPELCTRVMSLLRLRARDKEKIRLYELWREGLASADSHELGAFQQDAIECLLLSISDPELNLKVIETAYMKNIASHPFMANRFHSAEISRAIPIELAKTIALRADRYPGFLVFASEKKCKAEAAKSVRPVGLVAQEEKWFN